MYRFLFYSKFIIFLYMFQALLCLSSGGQNCIIQHLVSSHYVDGRPVRRLRDDLRTGRSPTVCDDTRCCIIKFDLLMMSTQCSKHAEEYNKSYYKTRICTLSWSNAKIILRCTVSKTSKLVLFCFDDVQNFVALLLFSISLFSL